MFLVKKQANALQDARQIDLRRCATQTTHIKTISERYAKKRLRRKTKSQEKEKNTTKEGKDKDFCISVYQLRCSYL